MPLAKQTVALLDSARDVVRSLPADAVLLLTETDLDWDDVYAHLKGCRVLVAAESRDLTDKLRENPDLDVITLDPEPVPTRERMSLALLKAVNTGHLKPGAHVVVLYNGIANPEDLPEPIDSLSLIHLGEHLERLTPGPAAARTRTSRWKRCGLVVDLATEIGREGREGKPVGTILVVGDTRKVLSMSQPAELQPVQRLQPKQERDIRDRKVREQIKEFAQLDGAILIDSEGSRWPPACHSNAEKKGSAVSKGFGTPPPGGRRHQPEDQAPSPSCVSQTSGRCGSTRGRGGDAHRAARTGRTSGSRCGCEALETEEGDGDENGE